jgi:hypothetical protein
VAEDKIEHQSPENDEATQTAASTARKRKPGKAKARETARAGDDVSRRVVRRVRGDTSSSASTATRTKKSKDSSARSSVEGTQAGKRPASTTRRSKNEATSTEQAAAAENSNEDLDIEARATDVVEKEGAENEGEEKERESSQSRTEEAADEEPEGRNGPYNVAEFRAAQADLAAAEDSLQQVPLFPRVSPLTRVHV